MPKKRGRKPTSKSAIKKHHVLGEIHHKHTKKLKEPLVVVAVPKSTWQKIQDWF